MTTTRRLTLVGTVVAFALAGCDRSTSAPAEPAAAPAKRIPAASSQEVWTAEQLGFLQEKFGELQTLPSGLKFKILQPGTGTASPPKGKRVSVDYQGRFLNDQVFDDSKKRGKPLKFAAGVGSVVKGFDEAVLAMKPGEKRLVVIPYWLGYGPRYHGQIPPSSTLVFEIELLGWEDTVGIPMSQQ